MSGVIAAHRAKRGAGHRSRRRAAAFGIAVALVALFNPSHVVQAAPAQDDTTTTEAPDEGDAAQETTEEPTTEAPSTTAPASTTEATTEADDPESPATTPAEIVGDDAGDSDDDTNWLLLAVVALGLLVVIAVLSMVLAGARRRAQEAHAFKRRLAEVVGRAQWLHDDGSLAVLGAGTAPERMQTTWDDTRRRVNDVSSQAAALVGNAPDDEARVALRRLSQAVSRLGGALDVHASLHMQMADDPSLQVALRGASDTVMGRRRELDAAIRPLSDRL